ncbi:ribonuclease H-like domain-containing protein, partial [Tanacetum coccineum]
GSQVAYLLLYVDDIILTASSTTLLQQLIDSLHREFDMTDLGALNYFLGISAVRYSTGLFLSQRKYDLQLLELAHMVNCNPSPPNTSGYGVLNCSDGVPIPDPNNVTKSCWGFQYLTVYHIQFVLMQFKQFSLNARSARSTNTALKRILR